MDTYRRVTGERLPFFHLDVNYLRLDWPEAARTLERAARARGIRFGIIYDGEGSQIDGGGSDSDWTAAAEQRFVTYESQYGGRPDDAVLQSWVDHPDYALPETRAGTFTWLIDRYVRPRTSLALGPGLRGRLGDADGRPIAGARIALTATALDGPGIATDYALSGTVPGRATTATVGLRVNAECGCSGAADITVSGIRFADAAGARTFDFSRGLAGWGFTGDAPFSLEPALHVRAAPAETAMVDSSIFPVAGGTRFTAVFSARVPPSARGSGYFQVLFLRPTGEYSRRIVPFGPAKVPLGIIKTGKDGTFRGSAPPRTVVEAWYRGDARHFPAYAKRG